MLDTIIKNGLVVNSDSSSYVDIGIKDGKIVFIGNSDYFPEALKTLDATGMEVYPGMIDSHVHVNYNQGEFTSLDTFAQASIAAAYGGTTTMIEFAIPMENETPLDALERRISEAKGNTYIDYSFHGCFTNQNLNDIHQVKEMIQAGIPSIKMFTTYENLMLTKEFIFALLKELSRHQGLALFHAENNSIISSNIKKFIQNKQLTPIYHAKSRPPIAEAAEIASLLTLIEETEAAGLFVHLSTGKVEELLKLYKQIKGLPVFIETCTHYLALDEEVYERENGHHYICSPPIHDSNEKENLWNMFDRGLIDIVSSDHCCFDTKQKDKYKDHFPSVPNGLPGIETRGIVLYSEGVQGGKITREQFAAITSENVAKMMGLYPNKGRIMVGSDADITIIDPKEKYKLTANDLHMQTDYTPFEGLMITGKILHTFVRGQHLIADGKFNESKCCGTFIKRTKPHI